MGTGGSKRLLYSSPGIHKGPHAMQELVTDWLDFVGIVYASSYGAGGVVVGELSECIPTVFRWEWPADIRANIRSASASNPMGGITNLDLEMAGILLLWLVMEVV
jgi:hypothetical protein